MTTTKKRHDEWTQADDLLVVHTVVRYIGLGKTQLQAFASAGRKLKRTPAAVSFRFNKVLRQEFSETMKEAKEAKNMRKAGVQHYGVGIPKIEIVRNQEAVEEVVEEVAVPTQMSLEFVEVAQNEQPSGIGYEVATILTNYTFLENKIRTLEAENAFLKSQKK